jgi:NADPH-dependent 2,4-dienoyl-CoA reductase/sulfur reductase-like enzyme
MRVIAPRMILATGARELFLPYPGWTLPNVMGIGGAQAMLKAGLEVRGKRVVIAGSGPLMLPVAAAMSRAGARLITVAEQTPTHRLGAFALALWSQPAKLLTGARYRLATPMHVHRTGTWVERADGSDRVETVTLTTGRRRWAERCDLLCCSHGLVPTTELARLLGCEVASGQVIADAMQRTTVPEVLTAGETTGVAGDMAAIAEGEIAGLAATSPDPSIPRDLRRRQRQGRRFVEQLRDAFVPRAELRRLASSETVICRCEDVRFGQLDASWTGRQAKLYSRVGMGPCQGAVCGPSLERLFGWAAGSVRPPLFAPSLGDWMPETTGPDVSDPVEPSR